MKVIPCLLDVDNRLHINKTTIAREIARQNKMFLWEEREYGTIDTVVIHYISAVEVNQDDPYSLESILDIYIKYGVSSHYLIARKGHIYRLVPEDKKAWHCGGSIMPEPDLRVGVNEFSIGIELMATRDSGFTDEQYTSLADLCFDIEKRHLIRSYVGHEDIAGDYAVKKCLRKDAKNDPGQLFDWDRFYSTKDNTGA